MTDWSEKIKAFLHDPPSKAFNIRGHKETARQLLDIYYESSDSESQYDVISAAADRPGVPGHEDECSVDFLKSPELTHPVSPGRLKIIIEKKDYDIPEKIEQTVKEALQKLPVNYAENRKEASKYYNLFEGLKQKLSVTESTLYSIWSKIPADTRVPDHSIWHHNALVSALAASGNRPYLMVFSMGPVQGFISEARKLRDLWTGSVLLSYLSWCGMKKVCEELGPDHVMYPSLSGQALFNIWLEAGKYTEVSEKTGPESAGIASFPNKFVIVLPGEQVKTIAGKIEAGILEEWEKIAESVYKKINCLAGANEEYFREVWNRQIKNLWEFNWVASPWLDKLSDDGEDMSFSDVRKLVKERERKNIEALSELFKKASGYPANRGIMYQTSHNILQSLLSSRKTARRFHDSYAEAGDKCVQCGRRQQLSVSEDREITRNFWEKIALKFEKQLLFRENERLCAVCTVKRLVHLCQEDLSPELRSVFTKKTFDSTVEVAWSPILRWLESKKKKNLWDEFVADCGGEGRAYEILHSADDEKASLHVKKLKRKLKGAGLELNNVLGKYYAVLLMDGDRMGELVSGKSKGLARWRDVMHSCLPEKFEKEKNNERCRAWLEKSKFDNISGRNGGDVIWLDEKRYITPAVHKAISEALGDFSLYTVPYIVSKHQGQLVYAGGDDVLAVMPVDKVFDAADEIRKYYSIPFLVRKYDRDGRTISIEPAKESYTPAPFEKLLIHPGPAATISGAIVIAHHKEPLRKVIQEAHRILDSHAKEKAGRNALAVCLSKRSGQERCVAFRWESEEEKVDNENKKEADDKRNTFVAKLKELAKELADEKVSSKLIYNIEANREAIEILHAEEKEKNSSGSVSKYIEMFIEKSERDTRKKKREDFSKIKKERAGKICEVLGFEKGVLNIDALIIARYLAQATIFDEVSDSDISRNA